MFGSYVYLVPKGEQSSVELRLVPGGKRPRSFELYSSQYLGQLHKKGRKAQQQAKRKTQTYCQPNFLVCLYVF